MTLIPPRPPAPAPSATAAANVAPGEKSWLANLRLSQQSEMDQNREFWQAQWSRMTLGIIRRWETDIDCKSFNTRHGPEQAKPCTQLQAALGVWVEPYVECAQRGRAHSHDILTDDAIRELRAAAKLLARQHAVSVMRSKWTRVCATHRWRRIVAQRHKVRWWTCARLRINHAHLRHTC